MDEMIVFVAIVAGGLLLRLILGRKRQPRYRKKAVLTGRERDFFYHLKRALPECQICPQVAVSALIEPVGIGMMRQMALDCIIGQKVSYAVFDEHMELVVVVELNHRSRPDRDEAARDAYFSRAGVRTVRFQVKRLPSEVKIRASIFPRSEALPGGRADSNVFDQRGGEIEFEKTPWRNTLNAHT